MPYTVRISDDRTYIVTTVKGLVDSRVAMEFTVATHRMAREKGLHLFLMDLSESRNIQSEYENYDFVNQDLDENPEVDRRVKVALYVSPDDHSHDFTEQVARSDGYNVGLFRKIEDAIRFLKEG